MARRKKDAEPSHSPTMSTFGKYRKKNRVVDVFLSSWKGKGKRKKKEDCASTKNERTEKKKGENTREVTTVDQDEGNLFTKASSPYPPKDRGEGEGKEGRLYGRPFVEGKSSPSRAGLCMGRKGAS